MDKTNDSREVIYRATEVVFPDFSDVHVPAKIDTGAYRSAIHATDIRLDENQVLHFRILGDHPVCKDAAFEASTDKYNIASISNSFGDNVERYEVSLRVKIGNQEYDTPFTLADRSKKMYPILLGRKALRKRFIIDIDKTGVDRLALKERFNIELPEDEETEDD